MSDGEIITPGAAAAGATSAAGGSGALVRRSFRAVYIPADASAAIAEWSIDYDANTEVSCILDRLKPHFAARGFDGADGGKEALRATVRKQIAEQLAKQNPGQPAKPVDDAMVDMILAMSAVDCVPLQNNKKTTKFIGLMMYVDDQGKAKQLPVNQRATQVTFECGCPTQVLGDCLIARNFDDENNFRRMDFSLKEFETEKAWKESAKKANEEKNNDGHAEKAKQIQELLAKTKQLSTGAAAAAASAPASKNCAAQGCGELGTLRCSRCKRTSYCSVACQKRDWKAHKANICVDTSAQAAADAAAVQKAAQ